MAAEAAQFTLNEPGVDGIRGFLEQLFSCGVIAGNLSLTSISPQPCQTLLGFTAGGTQRRRLLGQYLVTKRIEQHFRCGSA